MVNFYGAQAAARDAGFHLAQGGIHDHRQPGRRGTAQAGNKSQPRDGTRLAAPQE